MKSIFSFKNVVKISIGIYLLYFLSESSDLYSTNYNYFTKGIHSNLLLAIALFLLSFLLKLHRLIVVTSIIDKDSFKNIQIREFFSLHTLTTIFSLILPFKLGDFARVYLLRKYVKNYSNAVSIVVFERIVDLFVISGLLIVVGSHYNYLKILDGLNMGPRIYFLLFFILCIYILIYSMNFWYKILNKKDLLFLPKTKNFLESIFFIIKAILNCIKKQGLMLFLFSIAIWLFEILAFTSLYLYLDLEPSLIIFLSILTLLSFILPAGPAGLGSIQLVFFYAYESGLINFNIINDGFFYSIYVYLPSLLILAALLSYFTFKKNYE